MTKRLKNTGGRETITINGDPGASFNLRIKQEDNFTYDFTSDTFTLTDTMLANQTIGGTGKYTVEFIAPVVTDPDLYRVIIDPLGNTKKTTDLAAKVNALEINQVGSPPEMLFDNQSSRGVFTLASALTTGVKIIGNPEIEGSFKWSNTGTVVKGSDIIYVARDIASTDFTNATQYEKTVNGDYVGTTIRLNNVTGLSTGMYVEGKGIKGDVKISAISDPAITLDTSISLAHNSKLTFTYGKWKHDHIGGTIVNSGTSSLTLATQGSVSRIGVVDITSMLDVEDFVSRNPNAFPLKMKCAVGATTEALSLITPNTDADAGDSTYKCHALPASGHGTITQTGGGAISAGDTLTSGQFLYTAPSATTDVGTTKTWTYKLTNAGGRDSSTSTGVISIEITLGETTALELNI